MSECLLGGLPLNREERYYTATVLPMIVCKDSCNRLGQFLRLIPELEDYVPDPELVTFITEYNVKKSLPREQQVDFPEKQAVPDILIICTTKPSTMIAVEAKVFDWPTQRELTDQMEEQQAVLRKLQRIAGIERLIQVALLPQPLRDEIVTSSWPYSVITWERVLDAYATVAADDHFYRTLAAAMNKYPEKVSKNQSFSANAESELTGGAVYELYRTGSCPWKSIGRTGGLFGARFRNDIATGAWRNQRYQVSSQAPTNQNWFTIDVFVAAIDVCGRGE